MIMHHGRQWVEQTFPLEQTLLGAQVLTLALGPSGSPEGTISPCISSNFLSPACLPVCLFFLGPAPEPLLAVEVRHLPAGSQAEEQRQPKGWHPCVSHPALAFPHPLAREASPSFVVLIFGLAAAPPTPLPPPLENQHPQVPMATRLQGLYGSFHAMRGDGRQSLAGGTGSGSARAAAAELPRCSAARGGEGSCPRGQRWETLKAANMRKARSSFS